MICGQLPGLWTAALMSIRAVERADSRSGAEDGVEVGVGEAASGVEAVADAAKVRRTGVGGVDVRGGPVVAGCPVRAATHVAQHGRHEAEQRLRVRAATGADGDP